MPVGDGQVAERTDALGGAAPIPTTLPSFLSEGKAGAGGGRAVQGTTLKASGQSLGLALTLRPPGPLPGVGCERPKPRTTYMTTTMTHRRSTRRVRVPVCVPAPVHPLAGRSDPQPAATTPPIFATEIVSDSMVPTLRPGDHVFIDRRHRRLSCNGLYAIDDGHGIVVKRLEGLLGSPQVLVINDNPLYSRQTVALDMIELVGRVVARLSRM